ncbi:hypothetical protein BDZ89DRAFT_473327 [Hymenopellis radicata]|nr:hypothetical protein BDZ89DRAFT_473327 [Hymenopellis radicata]
MDVTCFRQASPARQLMNLVDIPVLMITSESGYHTLYDDCTASYLEQAGLAVTHIYLADVGIRGNGHMMFMEANRMHIAENVVQKWLMSVFRYCLPKRANTEPVR